MTTNKPAPQLVEPTFGEKLEIWYDRNGNWINILLIVVLAGIIGYKVYDWVQTRNVARANTDFGIALNQFQMAQQSPDEAQKIDQLQGAITAAQQVVDEHRDQFVGRQAQLMIGNAQYTIATIDEKEGVKALERARDSYRAYIDIAETTLEKAAGQLALGNILENLSFIQSSQQTLQQAAAAYSEAVSAAEGTHLGAEAKIGLARVNGAINSPESKAQAEKLLIEVVDNRDAQLLSEAELQGVKPVELQSGQVLSVEEVTAIKNLQAWSHKQIARDALTQMK